MRRMVITYGADGSVEHLLKDSFLKPGEDNQRRSIRRVSEILPTDSGRSFFIKFLMGPWKDEHFGEKHESIIFTGDSKAYYAELQEGGVEYKYYVWLGSTYTFPDYDTAVKWEIAIVNELRRRGVTFDD